MIPNLKSANFAIDESVSRRFRVLRSRTRVRLLTTFFLNGKNFSELSQVSEEQIITILKAHEAGEIRRAESSPPDAPPSPRLHTAPSA